MRFLPIFLILFSLVFHAPAQSAAQATPADLELSPADLAWKDAISALENRQYPDAQKKFKNFTRSHFSDPRVAEVAVRIGICDYRMGGRTSRALEVWNRTANMEVMQNKVSPALLLALEQLAAHYRIQKNQSELEKTLARLAEFFPENDITVREHVSSARSRLESGDYVGAAGLYGKVAAHLKGDDLLYYDLAIELSAPDSSVTAILISADKHFSENSVHMAARLYKEALKRNPAASDKHEAMTKLGWCHYVQKNVDQSERLWKEVIQNTAAGDKWRGQSRWHLVVLYAGYYNKPDQAIELCEIQAKEFPDSFFGQQALFSKAWLYWTRKDWDKAKTAFKDLVRAFPEKAAHPPIQKYIADCEQGMSARR